MRRALLGLVMLLCAGNAWAVPVPYIIGMTEAEARAALSTAGFQWVYSYYSTNYTMEDGLVAYQYPTAGVSVATSGAIYLYVADDQRVMVPALVGIEEGQAIALCQAQGLTVSVNSDGSEPPRYVQGQAPAGGVEVMPGANVTINTSANADDPSGGLDEDGETAFNVAFWGILVCYSTGCWIGLFIKVGNRS